MITNQQTIFLPDQGGVDDVAVPVLPFVFSTGDDERISEILSGRLRLFDFYAGMLPLSLTSTAYSGQHTEDNGCAHLRQDNETYNLRRESGGHLSHVSGTSIAPRRPPLSANIDARFGRTHRSLLQQTNKLWPVLVVQLLTMVEMNLSSMDSSGKDLHTR